MQKVLRSVSNKIVVSVNTLFFNSFYKFLVFLLLFSCERLKFYEPADSGKVSSASCTECHNYPGSDYCRSTTIVMNNKEKTQCSFCHTGSIKATRTLNDNYKIIYHDSTNGDGVPVTGKLHANGTVDAVFGQCTMCHDYAPESEIHTHHVNFLHCKCSECHLSVIKCTTEYYFDTILGDTAISYLQTMTKSVDGQRIPEVNKMLHLNKKPDVLIKKRVQDSINLKDNFNPDRVKWNNFTRSCSMNMRACHSRDTSTMK